MLGPRVDSTTRGNKIDRLRLYAKRTKQGAIALQGLLGKLGNRQQAGNALDNPAPGWEKAILCSLYPNLICLVSICTAQLAITYINASAQTAPITSSGLNTQISSPIPVGGKVQYDVTGGTRPDGGLNLFHSFGEFGVPNNSIANFHNNSGLATSNILGRVTGGNISNIFGTIQTTDFGSANLFLMNPAGFLFGPNAAINVGGMMSITSADYLRLNDGKTFNAVPNLTGDALLTSSPVAAFGFLGSNPGAITMEGSQFVLAETTGISLVGGNITIHSGALNDGTVQRAQISAPNGQIQLASTASPGEFDAALFLRPLPNVNGITFTSSGSVFLAQESNISISGSDTVSIRGGQFVLSVNDATLTTAITPAATDTISLGPGSVVAGKAGNIMLQAAKRIELVNSMVGSEAAPTSTGFPEAGGGIHLNSPIINLQDSLLSTSTLETSDAGNILLEVARLDVSRTEIATATQGPGRGGDIFVRGVAPESIAQKAVISEGVLRSESLGLHGNEGDAGNISIATERLSIMNGSLLATGTTASAGHAGNIEVTASDSVSISGSSVIDSSSTSFSLGDPGQISIRTPTGSVLIDGMHSGVFTDTQGSDAGGNIVIEAQAMTLRNGGTLSARTSGTAATATGGTITVDANTVTMTDGAVITVDSAGTADAGDINITAANGFSMQNGSITTQVTSIGTGNAGGGNIKITTSPAATVYLQGSTISASVADGSGGGGNVTIDPQFVILQNSKVLAKAAQGTGGHITIIASLFQPDAHSIVNADSGSGVHGTVTIQSPIAPASGKIQPMGNRPLQATSLLNQRCAALAGGELSSFTLAGNSRPIEPGGWLSSPVVPVSSMSHNSAQTARGLLARLDEPNGERSLLSLRQIVPPGFLVQSFSENRAPACRP
jgi:filamentous hemagglutinin family protein